MFDKFFGAMLGVSVEVMCRFVEGQIHLACQEVLKMRLRPVSRYGMFFAQTCTLIPSMHKKLNEKWKVLELSLKSVKVGHNRRFDLSLRKVCIKSSLGCHVSKLIWKFR